MTTKKKQAPTVEQASANYIDFKSINPNPNNPRTVKKKDFDKLFNSITKFPEMLLIRGLALNDENIILGGNQRYKAIESIVNLPLIERQKLKEENEKRIQSNKKLTDAQKKELSFFLEQFFLNSKIPYQNAAFLSDDKQREFEIRDNVSSGGWDYDALANEWNVDELNEWGMSLPSWDKAQQTKIEDKTSWFINIEFNDEKEAEEWFEKLTAEGLEVKIVR